MLHHINRSSFFFLLFSVFLLLSVCCAPQYTFATKMSTSSASNQATTQPQQTRHNTVSSKFFLLVFCASQGWIDIQHTNHKSALQQFIGNYLCGDNTHPSSHEILKKILLDSIVALASNNLTLYDSQHQELVESAECEKSFPSVFYDFVNDCQQPQFTILLDATTGEDLQFAPSTEAHLDATNCWITLHHQFKQQWITNTTTKTNIVVAEIPLSSSEMQQLLRAQERGHCFLVIEGTHDVTVPAHRKADSITLCYINVLETLATCSRMLDDIDDQQQHDMQCTFDFLRQHCRVDINTASLPGHKLSRFLYQHSRLFVNASSFVSNTHEQVASDMRTVQPRHVHMQLRQDKAPVPARFRSSPTHESIMDQSTDSSSTESDCSMYSNKKHGEHTQQHSDSDSDHDGDDDYKPKPNQRNKRTPTHQSAPHDNHHVGTHATRRQRVHSPEESAHRTDEVDQAKQINVGQLQLEEKWRIAKEFHQKEEEALAWPQQPCDNCKQFYPGMKIHEDNNISNAGQPATLLCDKCYKNTSNHFLVFGADNDMDVGEVPEVLKRLSLAEQQAIALCSNMVHVTVIQGSGQKKYTHHTITFPQKISEYTRILPRLPHEIKNIIMMRQRKDGTPCMTKLCRGHLRDALLYLKQHNEYFKNIEISDDHLSHYPETEDEVSMEEHNFGVTQHIDEEEEQQTQATTSQENVHVATATDECSKNNNRSAIGTAFAAFLQATTDALTQSPATASMSNTTTTAMPASAFSASSDTIVPPQVVRHGVHTDSVGSVTTLTTNAIDDTSIRQQKARALAVALQTVHKQQPTTSSITTPDGKDIIIDDVHIERKNETTVILNAPSHDPHPVSEYSSGLFTMAYPALFPHGKADYTSAYANESQKHKHGPISLKTYAQHLMQQADSRFATHPTFPYCLLNMIQRNQTQTQKRYFMSKRGWVAHANSHGLTCDELQEEVNNNPHFVEQLERITETVSRYKTSSKVPQ